MSAQEHITGCRLLRKLCGWEEGWISGGTREAYEDLNACLNIVFCFHFSLFPFHDRKCGYLHFNYLSSTNDIWAFKTN